MQVAKLPVFLSVINSTACRVSLANLACSFAFRRADAPSLKPCQPLCVAYARDCTGVDQTAAALALADISTAAGANGVCAAPSAPCSVTLSETRVDVESAAGEAGSMLAQRGAAPRAAT